MLFVLVLLALFSVVSAFQTFVPHRYAFSPSRRYLFGSPEPPKDDKKKGGLFGGIGDMMGNMKKIGDLTKSAQNLQKELAETIVDGRDAKNLAVASFNCVGKPVSIKISEEAMSLSAEDVSAAVTQAVVAATEKATATSKSRAEDAFKKLGIPIPPGIF